MLELRSKPKQQRVIVELDKSFRIYLRPCSSWGVVWVVVMVWPYCVCVQDRRGTERNKGVKSVIGGVATLRALTALTSSMRSLLPSKWSQCLATSRFMTASTRTRRVASSPLLLSASNCATSSLHTHTTHDTPTILSGGTARLALRALACASDYLTWTAGWATRTHDTCAGIRSRLWWHPLSSSILLAFSMLQHERLSVFQSKHTINIQRLEFFF